MRTIGIDIGSFSIKVAEIENSSSGNTLKDFYEVELSHELGGDIRFQTVETLKGIVSHYDMKKVRTVVGLGMERVSTRTLDFPFKERRKILQSLPFELEDNIPFSQDEAIFDFRVVSTKTNGSQVLALAVPKKYIQEVLALCDDAGFDPDVITAEALSLSNHFASELPPLSHDSDITTPAEIYIHFGYKKTLFNVTKNGTVIASRSIYFGGYDVATALSKSYELPFLEALKATNEKAFVLTTKAGADSSQVAFSQVITDAFAPLLTDIKRTMVDLKSQFKVNFENCILTGGINNILNLSAYVSQELGVPVSVRNNIPRSSQAMKLLSTFQLNGKQERIASVAIGLALEGVRKPKSPAINFRKNELSKQSQNLKIWLEGNKNLIAGTAIVLVGLFVYSFLRGSFAQDNLDALDHVMSDQAKNNNVGLSKANTKTEALNKFIKNKKAELEGRKEVIKLNQMSSALEVLKTISSALPSKDQIKLDLKNFRIADEQIVLAGQVSSVEEFSLLQRKISQIPLVSGVKGSPFPAPAGKYGFQMTLNMKRNKAKDAK